MTYGAFGLVEVVGSSNAVYIVDKMLKTADVQMQTWDVKYGGHVTVFLSGDVSAIKAAVDAAKEDVTIKVIAAAVMSNPSKEAIRLVEESKNK